MNTLVIEQEALVGEQVFITDDTLSVDLSDGRSISVPLTWFPRLLHANQSERNNWRWIGGGKGIHWPLIDEDISIQHLVIGKPSGESAQSFDKWFKSRESS